MKVENIQIDGINHYDYPDYCDAYCVSAERDGIPLTEEELIEFSESDEFRETLLDNIINKQF